MRVTVASGIAAPVGSEMCPEMDPAVCADNLADVDISTRNATIQQVSTVLDRETNLQIRRSVCERPVAFSLTWNLEVRKAANWPFSDTSLTWFFNIVA
jgi:hypothetical protein